MLRGGFMIIYILRIFHEKVNHDSACQNINIFLWWLKLVFGARAQAKLFSVKIV